MATMITEMSADPTPAELLARVQALAPRIAARAAEADRLRDIPRATIDELRDAGLFRLFQPANWGGLEMDPRVFFDIQNVIAESCASTAWVYGVLSVQSLVLALFDTRAQADVWGADDCALVSSSLLPAGKVVSVDGGFRLEGRWSFSSGSSFCQWAMLGAIVPEGSDQAPGPRVFLVPRSDYEIVDVWHTFGLRGTGSNDLVVNDVFVPAYRTIKLDPGIVSVAREARPGAPLYRLPWLYLFAASVSNFAIGAGRGAVDAFLERARARISAMTGKASKEDPNAHMAAARLHAEIETVEAMYRRHIDAMMAKVDTDEPMTMAEGMLYRTQLTSALRGIASRVDDLMLLLGARAINLDSRFTRAWLDLSAARVHPGNDPNTPSALLGQGLLAEAN
jgi:3-hydroxy-9,10-secoandrosta-1,3,5(10)-triene-9,17-dione monooxygenase